MKTLVVGYGSIGRRHVLNLARLGCIDKIFIYTKKNNFGNSCVEKGSFIDASVSHLSNACQGLKINFAVIANQTYKHIDTAITLAEKGFHLFIEKPLSHNLEKVALLKKVAQRKKIKIFVAYNLRFLPAIQRIKNLLSRKVIGDLYFAKIEAGQYLPSWRTNINYYDSYSSKKEYGGGVALDLSHEVDYMRFLFGDPVRWKTLKSKASKLKINSEDIFEGIYKYKHGFMCNVHIDYIQPEPKRQIRILGSKGYILCDLKGQFLEICVNNKKIRLTDKKLFSIEDTYIKELRLFIKSINLNKTPEITIEDGIEVLKLLEDGHD